MKLCVALDNIDRESNLNLARELKDFDNLWLKVGFRSFIRDSKEFLIELKEINPNFKIFLDLKLYDIPNTMADASVEIAKLGVDMFNIHASAGSEAIKSVVDRLSSLNRRPLILAVTALTSFENNSFEEIYGEKIEKKAIEFSKMSFTNSLDGVVCSAFESLAIKESTSKEFLTLTPGIRPFKESSDDQKRVADIEFAKQNLVDFIVVGRPIYKSTNPKEVVQRILNAI